MIRYLLSTCALALCFFCTTAQDRRLSITPEYNIPLGKLAWTYKPGIGAQLNYSFVNNGNDVLVSYGFSVGYTTLPALADTLYYTVDKGGVDGAGLGRAMYSSFKMLQVKGTADLTFPLGKKFGLQAGAGIGIIYGMRDITFEDDFGASDGLSEIVGWGILVPTVGLECIVNEHISIVPSISYTAMIQLGSTDSNAMNYNADTGSFYNFCTPGVALTFYF